MYFRSRRPAVLAGILLLFSILTAVFVTAQGFFDQPKSGEFTLFKVMIESRAEAEILERLPVDPVVRIKGGYLVLADAENSAALAESGLKSEFIESGLNRGKLALDMSLDQRNGARFQVVYKESGLVLLRITEGYRIAPDGLDQIAGLGDGPVRVVFDEPRNFDARGLKDGMDLETLIAMIEQDSLESYVGTLQQFAPRVTGSAADYASRDWVYDKFVEFGYDSVVLDEFTYSGNAVQNIIAYKVGTTYPDHHIVVGGHKDAVSGSPGADDNGSGTAGVLEIARVLKDIPTEMTFIFICFTGEEQGLNGSWHYADEAAARGDSIVMMLNMDMIGYEGNTDNVKVYHGSDLTWPNLWLDLADSLSTGMNGVLSGTITASDHYPFQQNGYDVVFLIEYNFSDVYHTPNDDTTHMDFSYMRRIIQASLATAYQTQLLYIPTPGLTFNYPGGIPESAYPGSSTSFQIQIDGSSGGTVIPGSGILYYRPYGGTADSVLMTDLGSGLYEAVLPAYACEDQFVEFWVGADEAGTGRHYDGGPGSPHSVPVATAVVTAYHESFESGTGWTYSGGLWAIGAPTGNGGDHGGPDPSFAYKGMKSLCYNLNGDYTNGMPEYHATSGMIDCTNISNTKLFFRRWLGVEQPLYDHAYVRVSSNGTSWHTIWTNDETIYDGEWAYCEYDISSYADGQQIYIRFTMGVSDGAWIYCGWNIDELKVVGYQCDQAQISITTEDVPDWTTGMNYSEQLEASGGIGELTWSDVNGDLGGTGLVLTSGGLLWGVPSDAGPISFTAKATDEGLNFTEKVFSFTINPPLELMTTEIDGGIEGSIYSFTLQYSGGTGPMNWSDLNDDLDGTGLGLGPDGEISGTPIMHGEVEFTAEVEDISGATDSQFLTLSIAPNYICGDLDENGEVNILDIVFFIDFKYKDGPEPGVLEAADVDGNLEVNILDIIYLIDYKFKDGPEPACP